jgi:hypothetical protein
MNLDGDYTPQMVIGGAMQCVGSDRRSIAEAIAAAHRASPLGRVSLHASSSPSGRHKLQVKVNATTQISHAPGATPPVVMLAIFENGLVTRIGGGENGGREIKYDYTVRELVPAFELNAAEGASVEKQLSIDLDPSWSLDHLGVAAFIQDPVSLKIDAAASQYPIAMN